LLLLAIPSVLAGFAIGGFVFSDFLQPAIFVSEKNDVIAYLAKHYHGVWEFILHGLKAPPVWLAFAGVALAWLLYLYKPQWREALVPKLSVFSYVLQAKYGFDRFNQVVFAGGSRALADIFAKITDKRLIDGLMVNGSAHSVAFFGRLLRHLQTGVLSHYAFVMIVGLLAISVWLYLR
jgi:NADH-quinone oxidoreductase subunit L